MPIFGAAGEHARQVIRRRAQRLAVALAALWLLVTVWLLVMAPARWWLGLPILLVTLFWQRRDLSDLFDSWVKGARGEEAVGRLLAELDGDGYHVLHDIDIGYGNLDHVVIGPTGAFALETKAWTGRVWLGKGPRLMRNRQDETKTVRQVQRAAMEVKDRIERAGVRMWVEAVVVLTATKLRKGTISLDRQRVTVLEADQLVGFIRGRRPTTLTKEELSRAASGVMLGKGFKSYRILDS